VSIELRGCEVVWLIGVDIEGALLLCLSGPSEYLFFWWLLLLEASVFDWISCFFVLFFAGFHLM